jgi:glycosyltransferase A (GT-A) superfamily protein (DUF2064 family)
MSVGGAIVVIAKCPISGVSKTRCAPLLGYDGAASLAKAMLSDILVTLSECVSMLVIETCPLSHDAILIPLMNRSICLAIL